MGLFKKKKTVDFKGQPSLRESKDKIEFFKITERNEEILLRMCDLLKEGRPVLANFDTLVAVDCNFMLAFLSGCVYALDGEVIQMQERLFLFAGGNELIDGSVREWVEENK